MDFKDFVKSRGAVRQYEPGVCPMTAFQPA
jgi:hypothetical protein